MKYKLIIDREAEEEIVATVHAPSSLKSAAGKSVKASGEFHEAGGL